MSKRSFFTNITPLPVGVTRETVIKSLHDHLMMIDLNPLVINRAPCKAPRFATADEYFSTWYILKDKVQYIPGSNKIAGDVSYHACFHDLPTGLQTHVYAPLGLDIRNKWTLGESKPGEAVELGLDIPKQGLWLREDVEIRCNLLLTPFVKKTLRKAHSTLVDRLVELSQLTENVKSDQQSISERASVSSYGGETVLSFGSNPQGSVSTGNLPPPQVPAPLRPRSAYQSPPPDAYTSQVPPPSFQQSYGTANTHTYSKQYEEIRNRAQAVQGNPNAHIAELPATNWASDDRGVAELPG